VIRGIEHVQLAMPAGSEDEARAFYAGILGLDEVPKPPELAARGGAWFEQPSAGVKVHLGVEQDFRPARKAHVGFLVDDVEAVVRACRDGGLEVVDDEPLDGYARAYVYDPFGNRIELLQPT
jgi:catechol 2,3-dioxygenase-like lactoylglutathione lyase family enzyme